MAEGKYKLSLEVIESKELYSLDYINGKLSELGECYSEIVSNKKTINNIAQKSRGSLILRNTDVIYEAVSALESLFSSCNEKFMDVIPVTQSLLDGVKQKNTEYLTEMYDTAVKKKEEQQTNVKAANQRLVAEEERCWKKNTYNIGSAQKTFQPSSQYYAYKDQLSSAQALLKKIENDIEKIETEKKSINNGTSSSGATHSGSSGKF